mmetsp:Transcript_4459/g.9735  ORF Transcript_4459/g.9735 Transcript_4459/m.9735 type:complete len:225 (-) Transcript_4459:17-691(-)
MADISSSSSSSASAATGLLVGALFEPDMVSALSSVITRSTSSSAASSSSSPSNTSNASSTISSITPAVHISFCIACMVSCISETLASLFIILITSVLFCMCPVTFCCASWFSICMTTEFICALEVCIRVVALRERTISFASIFAVPVSPRLAASLIDRLILSSSRWILRICLSTLRCSERISDFHFLTCSFGSAGSTSAATGLLAPPPELLEPNRLPNMIRERP